MLATNEKDVDFKSVMCIFICTFPFGVSLGDSVSNWIFLCMLQNNQITFCLPKSYTVMVLNFLFSIKGFI